MDWTALYFSKRWSCHSFNSRLDPLLAERPGRVGDRGGKEAKKGEKAELVLLTSPPGKEAKKGESRKDRGQLRPWHAPFFNALSLFKICTKDIQPVFVDLHREFWVQKNTTSSFHLEWNGVFVLKCSWISYLSWKANERPNSLICFGIFQGEPTNGIKRKSWDFLTTGGPVAPKGGLGQDKKRKSWVYEEKKIWMKQNLNLFANWVWPL